MKEEFVGNRRLESRFALPEKLVGLRRILPYALLLSITFALYSATLYFSYVWDDDQYILENFQIQNLTAHKLWQIWTAPYFFNYAPLHEMLLALIYYFSGQEMFGYHLAQLLLHGACACMLYFLLQRLEGLRIALLASLLFVVYPGNIETVAWVSESKSTLALAFFLVSFWCFIRFRESARWNYGIASGLLLICSLLAKTSTIAAPVIYLLYDLRKEIGLRKMGWSLVPFFLISAFFGVAQIMAVRLSGSVVPDRFIDSALRPPGELPLPMSGGYYGGMATHILNLPGFVAFYERMIMYPHPLTIWHMIPIYAKLNWTVAGVWILLLATLLLLRRSPSDVQFWGLWFFVFLAPVLQIIPNQIWVAERYLYIPAIGAFVLISKSFFLLFRRARSVAPRAVLAALILLVVFCYVWQTHSHVPAWKSGLSLWENALPNCPTSAFCHSELGNALLATDSARGVRELVKAVELRPTAGNWGALGEAYAFPLGDYTRAHEAFRKAQTPTGGASANLVASAAKTYYLEGNFPAAFGLVDLGLQRNPNNSWLLIVRGFLQWKTGHLDRSKIDLRQALQINSENPLTEHPARFLNFAWGRPAEVGQLMHEVGSL